jgi:hypothetical protein
MTDQNMDSTGRECVRKRAQEDAKYTLDMSAMTGAEVRDVILSFRISRSLSDRIERYRMAKRWKKKTETLIELLEAGVFLVEQAGKMEEPALVKYLRENLYNVELVDEIMGWDQGRIDAVLGALVAEKDRRIRLKIGNR